MSLQVSGWVFLTWCLMVEVCHLLVIITTFYRCVLDQTPLMVPLKILALLTFSAAKCPQKEFHSVKVKRKFLTFWLREGQIKMSTLSNISKPVFDFEMAPGANTLNISCVIHFRLLTDKRSSFKCPELKPWIHEQRAESLPAAMEEAVAHYFLSKCSCTLLNSHCSSFTYTVHLYGTGVEFPMTEQKCTLPSLCYMQLKLQPIQILWFHFNKELKTRVEETLAGALYSVKPVLKPY